MGEQLLAAVYRPVKFLTLTQEKKINGRFLYAPTDHFTSVDVPPNTTVPS